MKTCVSVPAVPARLYKLYGSKAKPAGTTHLNTPQTTEKTKKQNPTFIPLLKVGNSNYFPISHVFLLDVLFEVT